MKVSIITVVYNNANTVAAAVESVIHQDYENIEYIIIDGGSDDGTLDILKEYKEHFVTFISEPDEGIYDAMNKGLKIATGDIIGILNADDLYSNNSIIAKVVDEFKGKGGDAIYGDLQYVDKENKKIIRNWKAGSYNRENFKKGWMPPHPTFFVRKEIYRKYGYFNENFKIAADYELMLRFLYKNKISVSYIPEVLVRMRTGGESNSSFANRLQIIREDYKAWKVNDLDAKLYTQVLKRLTKLRQYLPILSIPLLW
jgi:glycosyltransferase involved in cell wall biosynthesis